MLFSIIVPMHNSSQSISLCIDSIKKQSYENFECFLIDDGSTDNTIEICDSLVKGDARFFVIAQKNKGVSAARNRGLERASGDYLVFIDSDDCAETNLLQQLEKAANGEIIQYGFYAIYGEKKQKKNNCKEAFDIMAGDMAVVWRHAIPAKKTRDLRFDESLSGGEDYLYLNQALKKVEKVKSVNECLYNHKFDQKNSIMNNLNFNLLNQQVVATEKVKALYDIETLKKNKRAFHKRENWCKGELVLYTFNLFDNNTTKIKSLWRKLLKKIALILLK